MCIRDSDQTTSFIVVAATLLDLKAARLLPQGEVDDPEELAVLEARDLLFARLLQYRAFKTMAAMFASTFEDQGRRHAHPGGLEDQFRALPVSYTHLDVYKRQPGRRPRSRSQQAGRPARSRGRPPRSARARPGRPRRT